MAKKTGENWLDVRGGRKGLGIKRPASGATCVSRHTHSLFRTGLFFKGYWCGSRTTDVSQDALQDESLWKGPCHISPVTRVQFLGLTEARTNSTKLYPSWGGYRGDPRDSSRVPGFDPQYPHGSSLFLKSQVDQTPSSGLAEDQEYVIKYLYILNKYFLFI